MTFVDILRGKVMIYNNKGLPDPFLWALVGKSVIQLESMSKTGGQENSSHFRT